MEPLTHRDRRLPALPNEEERRTALRRYHILGTGPERDFDRVTRLAAQTCHVPTALIVLLDGERQWFKSCFGYQGARETDLGLSFAAAATRRRDTLIVEDATQDPRFAEAPAVTGEPDWRFYAGTPLQTPEGVMIGTLCIVDREPRVFEAGQRAILEDLADMVVGQLEKRRIEARGRRYERLVANVQEVVFETDLEGEATFLSNAWEEATGFSTEEALGESLAQFVHPKDRVEALQAFAPLLKRRQDLLHHETRFLTKDGTERPVEFRARLVTDEDDTPTGTVGTLTPLDETTYEAAPEPAPAERAPAPPSEPPREPTAPLKKLAYVSRAVQPMTAADLTELLGQVREKNKRLGVTGMLLYKGQTFMQVLEGVPETVDRLYNTISADERHDHVEVLLDEPVAEREFADWAMGFRRLGVAEGDGSEGFTDFLDEEAPVREFAQAPGQARQLLLHFNTRSLPAGTKDVRPDVEESGSVDRDESLSEVRDRLAADPPQLHTPPLDFFNHLHRVLDRLEPAARRKGVTIERAIPRAPAPVKTDVGGLRLLVDALVSNALSSSGDGGTITVGASTAKDDTMHLRVEDDGADISKDLLESLLDVDAGTDGEGEQDRHLQFVHRLVNLMQGSMEMESERGRGTVFSITLPRLLDFDEAEDGEPTRFSSDAAEHPAEEAVPPAPQHATEPALPESEDFGSDADAADSAGEEQPPEEDAPEEELFAGLSDWGEASRTEGEPPAADDPSAEDAEDAPPSRDEEADMPPELVSALEELPPRETASAEPSFPELETVASDLPATDGETLADVRRRLSTDPPDLRSSSFDYAEHLRALLDELEPAARRKGLVMHRALPDRSVSVEADPGALRLLVAALVGHAVDATDEGSITVSARVQGEDEVRLRVVDTGADISKGLLDSLLNADAGEPGTDDAETEQEERHLNFVHRLVNLMRGAVEMESRRGRGTVFTVTLPRHADAVARAPGKADPPERDHPERDHPERDRPKTTGEEPAAFDDALAAPEASPSSPSGGDGAGQEWSSWETSDEWTPAAEESETATGEPEATPADDDSPVPSEAENTPEADDEELLSWERDSIFSTSSETETEADADDPNAFRTDPDSPFSF